MHPLGSSKARHIELASGLSEACLAAIAGVVATVVAAAADAEGTSVLAA